MIDMTRSTRFTIAIALSLSAASAAAAVWLLLTLAMGAYSLSQSLSIRVIVLDSSVNLVGMVAASLAGAWSQREVSHPAVHP